MKSKVLFRELSLALCVLVVLSFSISKVEAQGFYASPDHWSVEASFATGKYTSYFNSPFTARRFLKHRITYKAQSVGVSRYFYDDKGVDWASLRVYAGELDLHELQDESFVARRYGHQSRGVALEFGHRGPKVGAIATLNVGKLVYIDELEAKIMERDVDFGGEVYLGPSTGASVFAGYGGFNTAFLGSRYLFGLRYGMKRTDGTNLRMGIADSGFWTDATFSIMEGEFTLNPSLILRSENFQFLLTMRYNLLQ